MITIVITRRYLGGILTGLIVSDKLRVDRTLRESYQALVGKVQRDLLGDEYEIVAVDIL
jgi:hypothetical protein